MSKQKFPQIPSSEITPKDTYLSRREFIKIAGVVAGSVALTACGASPSGDSATQEADGTTESNLLTDELGDPANTLEDITHYNNYYEFTTDKEGVARLAEDFTTSPWDVEVSGLVNN